MIDRHIKTRFNVFFFRCCLACVVRLLSFMLFFFSVLARICSLCTQITFSLTFEISFYIYFSFPSCCFLLFSHAHFYLSLFVFVFVFYSLRVVEVTGKNLQWFRHHAKFDFTISSDFLLFLFSSWFGYSANFDLRCDCLAHWWVFLRFVFFFFFHFLLFCRLIDDIINWMNFKSTWENLLRHGFTLCWFVLIMIKKTSVVSTTETSETNDVLLLVFTVSHFFSSMSLMCARERSFHHLSNPFNDFTQNKRDRIGCHFHNKQQRMLKKRGRISLQMEDEGIETTRVKWIKKKVNKKTKTWQNDFDFVTNQLSTLHLMRFICSCFWITVTTQRKRVHRSSFLIRFWSPQVLTSPAINLIILFLT